MLMFIHFHLSAFVSPKISSGYAPGYFKVTRQQLFNCNYMGFKYSKERKYDRIKYKYVSTYQYRIEYEYNVRAVVYLSKKKSGCINIIKVQY